MARRSKAESEETARRVLAVAREHLTRAGYGAVAVEAIAAEAGVTRGAVYHHFDGKTGLFRAVVTAVQVEVGDHVATVAEAETTPWEQLRAGCHAFLDAATSPQVARIMLVDAPAVLGWSEWRRIDAAASGTHLREAVSAVVDELVVGPDLVDVTAALLSGTMNEAALVVAEQPDDRDLARRTHAALDAVLDGLRATRS